MTAPVPKSAKSVWPKSAWIAVIVAAVAVIGIAVVIARIWSDTGGAEMSAAGWGALVLGAIVTLGLGVGLMSLVFISHRRGYDELDRDRR